MSTIDFSSLGLSSYEVISVPPTISTTEFGDVTSANTLPTTTVSSAVIATTSESISSVTSTRSDRNGSRTTFVSITTSSTEQVTSPAVTAEAIYRQILDAGMVANIGWTSFTSANFDKLCPSGNCVQDCQNYSRLFEEVPYLIGESYETYGKALNGQAPSITLFGVCSNLANVYAGISAGMDVETKSSYFPQSSEEDVADVSATIASCMVSTCDAARQPENCMTSCNMTVLYEGSMSNLTGMTQCLTVLCGNTCGLPYASQDVMGVGVLVSYVVQAVLVILCAIGLIVSAIFQLYRSEKKTSVLSDVNRRGLEAFLAAQCYFTLALEIAALCTDPWQVDPLSGYALLSVAITGFLCPVFTLMLLHSNGCRTWYGGTLVILSYILSSLTFWALHSNLSTHIGTTTGSDETLRQLYEISSCGDSSAIALCPQTIGNDPLEYLAKFYNHGGIPNLHTMPLLWAWSTLVLIILLGNQLRHAFGLNDQKRKSLDSVLISLLNFVSRVFAHPVALFLASTLFALALAYQAQMLRQYAKSDVIDWDGWSFGQVVAVVIWVQPLVDYVHLWSREHFHFPIANSSLQTLPLAKVTTAYPPISQGQSVSSSTPVPSANVLNPQTRSFTPSPVTQRPNPATRVTF